MKFQESNFLEIKKELEKSGKFYKFLLEPSFVNYLKNYNSFSKFIDISFILKNNESILYCPITIETTKDNKNLNFFGEPFFILCENKNKEILKLFYEKIKNFIIEKQINKINFLVEKPFRDLNSIEKLTNNNLSKYSFIKYIDLSQGIETIKKNFSKGHKSAIKKEYNDLEYKVIDFRNYDNDIIKMMEMHHEVSKKITRSKESWLSNGEMIKDNNGIIVKAIYKKKIISFSFFFFNKIEALYFSSCTDRKYFRDFVNITHKSILHSIIYFKEKGCKKLTLGDCKTIYSLKSITEKERNIEKFKSSFGGDIYTNFYFNNINPNFIDLYLK